jgi:endonuclease YncB( thermonuclease family)
MKKQAIALLVVVIICVCALQGMAQKKQQATKTKPTAPQTPAATAPANTASREAAEQPGAIQGKVVELGWGDSVTVLDAQSKKHRVRLLGIDAPEKEQPFGPVARQKLSMMVFGKTVNVKYQKMDRNGRALGKVTLGALDVNLEMLKAGLAWYYPNDRDLPESDRPLYSGAEREARTASRGLWQDEAPLPPWEFRQARRQQPSTPAVAETTPEPPETAPDATPEKPGDALAAADKSGIPAKNPEQGADQKGVDQTGQGGQAEGSTAFPKSPRLTVTGDSTTRTYYKAGCPEGERVLPQNRVSFGSIEEAERAGFKRTPNCP